MMSHGYMYRCMWGWMGSTVHYTFLIQIWTWDWRKSSADFVGHKVVATCMKSALSSPLPQQSSWGRNQEQRQEVTIVPFIPHHSQMRWRLFIMTYRLVEHIQDLDGSVFTRRPRDIQSLDVRRVVEVDQLFGNLWTVASCTGCFKDSQTHQVHWSGHSTVDSVCLSLTVSLFMKPQIAAATSQANRITKKKKNLRKETRKTVWFPKSLIRWNKYFNSKSRQSSCSIKFKNTRAAKSKEKIEMLTVPSRHWDSWMAP